VEAVCVSEDKSNHHVELAVSAEEPEEDRAYGGHVRSEGASCGVAKAAVSAEEPEADRAYGGHVRMDATALIAKRMGIDQGEVESKLLQLHQRGELDSTAGLPHADSEEDINISLTSKVLEDFEKAEAEAKLNMSQTATPYKLTFKPSVLATPSASVSAAATPAPSASPDAPQAAPQAAPQSAPASSASPAPASLAPPVAPHANSHFAPSVEMQEGNEVFLNLDDFIGV
jgi:hypothetical protein